MHKEATAGHPLIVTAPAKINLYLKIIGRRQDGYHLLHTLMQKIGLTDELILEKKVSGISLMCSGSSLPVDNNNIVYRAARLFFDELAYSLTGNKVGASIILKKKIPVAAGLGGGSSDAAATLLGLNRLYKTRRTVNELLAMAVRLGADVPQFIVNWPVVWATGIGDCLQPAVPLKACRILLVNPEIQVSTRWVYEKFALTAEGNLNNLKNWHNKNEIRKNETPVFTKRSIRPDELENDLEKVTAVHYPVIESLKKRLLSCGATAALMSGSGPTVFGLFPWSHGQKAIACYKELTKDYEKTYLVQSWH